MNNSSTSHIENEYLINVKKTIENKEKSSIVDVRDVNWELTNGVWKNDAGWEPSDKESIKKLEEWIEKSSKPIKETPLSSSNDQSWKEVVAEQRKAELTNKTKHPHAHSISTDNAKEDHKLKKRGAFFYFILTLSIAFGTGGLYMVFTPSSDKTKKFLNEIASYTNPNKNSPPILGANERAYFMKYIIEESIWRAKIRAALYNKAQGYTKISELGNYTNINATALEVIDIVNKMFDKAGMEGRKIKMESLKPDLLELEKAMKMEESLAKKSLCKLANKQEVFLGTYPSKRVAERALKDKWISPLGNLHEATTGQSHQGRYPTALDDPRSVGLPVSWK